MLWTVSHNPSLLRFPAEAAIVGRMVVGFGELEVLTCKVADLATANSTIVLKALYNLKSTSARLDFARTIAAPIFEAEGLSAPFKVTLDGVDECRSIRNQYAHCQWADDPTAGLFFADLQKAASRSTWIVDWKHIDVPLLETQESFFDDTRRALLFLQASMDCLNHGISHNHGIPEPLALPPQRKHNPASQHVPPWLNEDLKALHIRRAQEDEAPSRPRERPPSVLKLTEEEWRAKCAKQVREGRGPCCQQSK
jgi:hypothetical protein